MRLNRRIPDEIWPGLLGGVLSGLVGALLFAAAHAVLIVPIWTRMGSGPVFGVLAGAAAGWALAEHYPAHLTSSALVAAGIGARFGAVLWLLVAPVTAAHALHGVHDLIVVTADQRAADRAVDDWLTRLASSLDSITARAQVTAR